MEDKGLQLDVEQCEVYTYTDSYQEKTGSYIRGYDLEQDKMATTAIIEMYEELRCPRSGSRTAKGVTLCPQHEQDEALRAFLATAPLRGDRWARLERLETVWEELNKLAADVYAMQDQPAFVTEAMEDARRALSTFYSLLRHPEQWEAWGYSNRLAPAPQQESA